MLYVYVGLAGALGALVRYEIGVGIHNFYGGSFPFPTLAVNLIGSFLLGWLTHFLFRTERFSPTVVTALGTGFIGSFTTFSTFSVETIVMIETGNLMGALFYVTLSIFLGLFSSWMGYKLGNRRFRRFTSREGES
ncbi:fluoride efflux transporter CrcB [Exiguobacterium aurantiacum]|uniref:Fluoride-specific ion channel FluC n=1 Tax=Exiguobacterium aurantiacum TaxID=33987 RepID=A0ABY5FLJ6_9BACL|nr:fluoride efflux transporter CrcB [Exiguobacterium aurantiacum]UTT42426.1 fluoride efflux transporter CrcB [Exiguobacterium aurantiacum]